MERCNKVEHKLIRTGPYKWVRNPAYTGIIIGVIGSTVADGELLALLAIVLIVVGFLIKIRTEEKFLLEEFGEVFIQYKKDVKSLISFVY